MNKEELLKAIEQKRQALWPSDTGEMKPATVSNNLEQGWLNALSWMEKFINSIAPEQQSSSLDKFIHTLLETYPTNKNEVPIEALNDYHQGLICGARKTYNWILRSAFDGEITKFFDGNLSVKAKLPKDSKCCFGDKVKVIIIKEDK